MAQPAEELAARYNDKAGRLLYPDQDKLRTLRMHLLTTRYGPLDVLAVIGTGSTFEDLVARTRMMEVAGSTVRVLDLEAVIESKEQANRPKDLAVLPVLRETLRLNGEGSWCTLPPHRWAHRAPALSSHSGR